MAGERRRGSRYCVAGFCVLTLLASAAAAQAIPVVSIEGGTGVPGGSVAALARLAGDSEGTAVSADLTVRFPDPPLGVDLASCLLDARLSGTHQLTAELPSAGELHLSIVPADGPTPLNDGPLATCNVTIALGTPAGTAALDLTVELRDAADQIVPADAVDGAIIIESLEPTSTPVNTATPTETLTITPTPLDTLTPTPTITPTPTPFQPTVLYDRFGSSCAVVGPSGFDAWPLLGLLALLWRRGRHDG